MPRTKLILICQSGGEFRTNDDGSLSYAGGDAHAVDVNHETPFDDLKLRLAEICNFEHTSLSVKYFIPGNKRIPITLSTDKDLKRMFDFYGDAITAEVYISGKEGFDKLTIPANRASVIKGADIVPPPATSPNAALRSTRKPIKVTPGVSSRKRAPGVSSRKRKPGVSSRERTPGVSSRERTPGVSSRERKPGVSSRERTPGVSSRERTPGVSSRKRTPAVPSSRRTPAVSSRERTPRGLSAASCDTVIALAASGQFTNKVAGKSKRKAPRDSTEDQAADATENEPTVYDINTTPADAVKKRRRTASRKIGENGPTVTSKTKNGRETRKGSSAKKNTRKNDTDSSVVDVYVEQQLGSPDFISGSSQSYHSPASDNSDFAPLDDTFASWKGVIAGEGQDFENVAEFREVLQKYSIARRFGYRFKKNDTNRASVVCAAEGCSWKIHASWVPSEQVFRIKKMNNSHTCGGESWKAKHPSKIWLVSVIKDKLRESPHQKPKDIANEIQRDFGIELNYTQVWRGLEDARVQLQGSHKGAYSQLQWFCDKLMEANPGSSAQLLVGNENKFQCMFVSFHASIDGFRRGCRPLLFLDSTPLRSKYHEVLLTATGIDGNNDFFPVAFAVVDVENESNWYWFLEHLKSAISTPTSITFVSDKDKSLRNSVLDVFGDAHHGYSIFHLLDSFMFNLKGPFGESKSTLLGYLLSAVHAVRLESFRMSMEQIKRISVYAYDWLMQNEPEYWAKAVFKGEHYDHVTVDVAESYAEWIEEVSDKPIIQKVEAVTCKMMELICKRQIISNEWDTRITPSKEQKIREDTEKALCLKVLFSSDTMFEVHDDSVHVVNIGTRKCTCLEWELTGIPCRHAIAVFISVHRSPYDFCSKYFTIDSYRATYSGSIIPVIATFGLPEEGEGGDQEPVEVLPPTTPRPPPQKEKRHKAGEFRKTVTCSRCKAAGHNKVSCKEPLVS